MREKERNVPLSEVDRCVRRCAQQDRVVARRRAETVVVVVVVSSIKRGAGHHRLTH